MPSTTRKVLVVDSNAAVRAALIEMLGDLPVSITEAADGATALEALAAEPFRLVITDLYVRAGDSKCLVDAIRGNSKVSSTRVLVYSSRSQRADHVWAKNAGANAFFLRPVLRDRFRNAVRRLTSRGTTFSGDSPRVRKTA